MAKRLSKSRYTLFRKCEKAFWLNVNSPDKATPIDPAQKARLEQGNEVGDMAMELFGPFVEVTTKNADGSLNLTEMCFLFANRNMEILLKEGDGSVWYDFWGNRVRWFLFCEKRSGV